MKKSNILLNRHSSEKTDILLVIIVILYTYRNSLIPTGIEISENLLNKIYFVIQNITDFFYVMIKEDRKTIFLV